MKNLSLLNFAPWIGMLIFAFLYFKAENKIPVIDPPGAAVKTDVPVKERYKDPEGISHAVVPDDQNLLSKEYLKNKNRPKNMVDSAAANLKIATAEITRVTRISTMTSDSLLKANRVIDQLTKRLVLVYNDAFVKLKYTPPVDSTDTGSFAFAYNADLNIVQYQKRSWFLGAKKSFIDISSNDRRTTIMGVKQLTIQQKTPQFGLRIQASGNYNPQSGNLGFGPAVRVDLGRFSIQGNYLYYDRLEENKWRPGLIANYDLIRF